MDLYSTVSSSMGEGYTIVNVGEQTSQASVIDYSDESLTPKDGICLSTKFGDVKSCDEPGAPTTKGTHLFGGASPFARK